MKLIGGQHWTYWIFKQCYQWYMSTLFYFPHKLLYEKQNLCIVQLSTDFYWSNVSKKIFITQYFTAVLALKGMKLRPLPSLALFFIRNDIFFCNKKMKVHTKVLMCSHTHSWLHTLFSVASSFITHLFSVASTSIPHFIFSCFSITDINFQLLLFSSQILLTGAASSITDFIFYCFLFHHRLFFSVAASS